MRPDTSGEYYTQIRILLDGATPSQVYYIKIIVINKVEESSTTSTTQDISKFNFTAENYKHLGKKVSSKPFNITFAQAKEVNNWPPPKISRINILGEVTISFSKPLSSSDYKTELDSIMNNIDVGLSRDNLQMNWKITQLEDKKITLQLEFDNSNNAQTISTGQDKVNVTIRFLKTTIYSSSSSNSTRRLLNATNDLYDEYLNQTSNTLVVQEAEFVVTQELPPIVSSMEDYGFIKTVVQPINFVTMFFFVMTIVSNIFLTPNDKDYFNQRFWNFFNIIQLIVHLQILQITFPANMFVVQQGINWIFKLNFFDYESLSTWIFKITEDDLHVFRYNFFNIDYNSDLFAMNMGCCLYYFGLYLVLVLLFTLLKIASLQIKSQIIHFNFHRLQKWTAKIESLLVINALIRLFIESFIIIIISGLLSAPNFLGFTQNETQDANGGSIYLMIQQVLAIIFMLYSFLFPLMLYVMTLYSMKEKPQQLQTKTANIVQNRTISSFEQGLDRRSAFKISYSLVFFVRRIAIVVIGLYLQEHLTFQIWCNSLLSFASVLFLYMSTPYRDLTTYRIDLLNEGIMMFISDGLFMYTDLVSDAQIKYQSAWGILGLLGIIYSVNFYYQGLWVYEIIRYKILNRRCKQWCLKNKTIKPGKESFLDSTQQMFLTTSQGNKLSTMGNLLQSSGKDQFKRVLQESPENNLEQKLETINETEEVNQGLDKLKNADNFDDQLFIRTNQYSGKDIYQNINEINKQDIQIGFIDYTYQDQNPFQVKSQDDNEEYKYNSFSQPQNMENNKKTTATKDKGSKIFEL